MWNRWKVQGKAVNGHGKEVKGQAKAVERTMKGSGKNKERQWKDKERRWKAKESQWKVKERWVLLVAVDRAPACVAVLRRPEPDAPLGVFDQDGVEDIVPAA